MDLTPQQSAGVYDVALMVLFVLNVPVAFVCTVALKMRDARQQRARAPSEARETVARRQEALALHCSGLADAEDTRVLRDYFESLLLLDLDELAARIEGRGDAAPPDEPADGDALAAAEPAVAFRWAADDRDAAGRGAPPSRCRHTEPEPEQQPEPQPELEPDAEAGDAVVADYYDKFSTGFVGAFGGAEVLPQAPPTLFSRNPAPSSLGRTT